MACARVRLPEGVEDLLRSEMEVCILQANLGRDDTAIATRYLIDRWPQIEIAAELGWGKATVSRRIPYILAKVQRAAKRLNFTETN